MKLLEQIKNGKKLDRAAMDKARARWQEIAKPVGSLGTFEEMLVQLAGISARPDLTIDKRAVIVMCADNGVLAQGVAQTPGEITAVMADFIARERSSVCIMAKKAGAAIITVDIGMNSRLANSTILDRHIADGTADMSLGPAMSREQLEKAVQVGIDLVRDCQAQGYQILATGEMGIGNTTTSSAVAAILMQRPVEEVTGRGAGLSDEGLQRKIDAIKRAISVNKPDPADALDVLQKVGGFDLAGLCGVFLGGAIYGLPIIVDGFISATAALAASRILPAARDFMIASHVSAEPASRAVLAALDLVPVISAGMRLGEGTGAVAVLPLLDMTLAVYQDLMTFADIGM